LRAAAIITRENSHCSYGKVAQTSAKKTKMLENNGPKQQQPSGLGKENAAAAGGGGKAGKAGKAQGGGTKPKSRW